MRLQRVFAPCAGCGLSTKVRQVRVRPAKDPAAPTERVALCEPCLARPDRTWRRRWTLAPVEREPA